MINNFKVSFDFDGTLDKQIVQKFAQDLLLSGYVVFITTQRVVKSIDNYPFRVNCLYFSRSNNK